jgi:peptide/nickel transport system substrate-binding protein
LLYNFHKIFDAFTALERRVFMAAVAVLVLSAALTGIRFFYGATTIAPVEGGEFVEGVVGQPVTINPVIATQNDVDRDLIEILFTNVIALADQYRVSDDQKTWTISLKPDLHWSDGEVITSDDVVFTLESIQNPSTRSPLALN